MFIVACVSIACKGQLRGWGGEYVGKRNWKEYNEGLVGGVRYSEFRFTYLMSGVRS